MCVHSLRGGQNKIVSECCCFSKKACGVCDVKRKASYFIHLSGVSLFVLQMAVGCAERGQEALLSVE